MFLFCRERVHVGGKCSPYPGNDRNDAAFDPPVGGKIPGCQEDEPDAAHQDETNNIARAQSFCVAGLVADNKDGKKEPGSIPDHGNQGFLFRQERRQQDSPDYNGKQRY